MPLPAGVETVTISSGTPLTLPNGEWMQGELIFSGPDVVTIGEDDFIFGGGVRVPLIDGEFSVRLVATDATGMSPTGWAYRVDSRFTNAANWTGYIDLPKASPSVNLPDLLLPDPVAGTFTVLKDPNVIGNVVVSGTPTAGQVPTATSATAASWQTPSGDGGGGSSIVSTDGRIDRQIITLPPASGWQIVTTSGGIEIGTSVTAKAGDRLWYSPSFLRTYGVVLDLGIKAGAGGVSRYTSSGNSTPETDGYAPLYPQSAFAGVAGIREFVVQAGEVDGSGKATIVLAYRGNSADGLTQKVYFGGGPGYSGAIWVANMGPAPS